MTQSYKKFVHTLLTASPEEVEEELQHDRQNLYANTYDDDDLHFGDNEGDDEFNPDFDQSDDDSSDDEDSEEEHHQPQARLADKENVNPNFIHAYAEAIADQPRGKTINYESLRKISQPLAHSTVYDYDG